MIESNQFIFSLGSVSESILKEVEGDIDEELAVDPSSFIFLMAQMLPSTPDKRELNDGVIASPMNNPLTEEFERPTDATNDLTFNQQSIEQLDFHSAIAWINSESYQPPLPVFSDNDLDPLQQNMDVWDDPSVIAQINSQCDQPQQPKALLNNPSPRIKASLESLEIVRTQGLDPTAIENSFTLLSSRNLPEGMDDFEFETKVDKPTRINTQQPEQQATSNSNKDNISTTSMDSVRKAFGLDLELGSDNQSLDNSQSIVTPNPMINSVKPEWPAIAMPKALEIPAELSNPKWAEQFSERVVWLGQQGIQSAVIKIHPEDLGPLEINVKVVDDLATVTITSQSSQVRDIVEQALPRLREMMAENGLNLSDVSIASDEKSQHSSQQQANSEQEHAVLSEDEMLFTPVKKKPSTALVDYFA